MGRNGVIIPDRARAVYAVHYLQMGGTMNLMELMTERREVVLKKWLESITASYPHASSFLKQQKNRFANPVGYTIEETANTVLDAVIRNEINTQTHDALDRFMQIRAVQDFTPSRAVDFLLTLKQIMRETLKDAIPSADRTDEFQLSVSLIDRMVLISFESYTKYREKLYELKVNEFKHMAFRLLERANLTFEFQGDDPAGDTCIPKSDRVK